MTHLWARGYRKKEFPFFSTTMSCLKVKVMSTLFYDFPCVSRNMNTRRTPARRVMENYMHEEIPPQVEQVSQCSQGVQGDQVPIVEGGNDATVVPPELSNSDIREASLALA